MRSRLRAGIQEWTRASSKARLSAPQRAGRHAPRASACPAESALPAGSVQEAMDILHHCHRGRPGEPSRSVSYLLYGGCRVEIQGKLRAVSVDLVFLMIGAGSLALATRFGTVHSMRAKRQTALHGRPVPVPSCNSSTDRGIRGLSLAPRRKRTTAIAAHLYLRLHERRVRARPGFIVPVGRALRSGRFGRKSHMSTVPVAPAAGVVDLHTHSTCSDGALRPAELVERAGRGRCRDIGAHRPR